MYYRPALLFFAIGDCLGGIIFPARFIDERSKHISGA
jgi:hypothetical protein